MILRDSMEERCGDPGAAVLIYNKLAVSAADTDCGRDTWTDFLYCATLTASSATNSKTPRPRWYLGWLVHFFNSDRTGKHGCDNRDGTPAFIRL